VSGHIDPEYPETHFKGFIKEVFMSGRERLVVIGGNAAGMSAATMVRRLQPDMEIMAFERSDFFSYST